MEDCSNSHGGGSESNGNGIVRAMVIDGDMTSLKFCEMILTQNNYKVTACQDAQEALSILQERSEDFDIVIMEIQITGTDGINLLSAVKIKTNLPVITMCAYDDPEITCEALSCGSALHITKPINCSYLETIRQKALKKKVKGKSLVAILMKKRNLEEESFSLELENDYEESRAPRLVWDYDLHQRFLVVISLLGERAVPTKILDLMNVEGLSLKQVGSHLQKHRRRVEKAKQEEEEDTNAQLITPLHAQSIYPRRRPNPLQRLPMIRRRRMSITPDATPLMRTQHHPLMSPLSPTQPSLLKQPIRTQLANRGSMQMLLHNQIRQAVSSTYQNPSLSSATQTHGVIPAMNNFQVPGSRMTGLGNSACKLSTIRLNSQLYSNNKLFKPNQELLAVGNMREGNYDELDLGEELVKTTLEDKNSAETMALKETMYGNLDTDFDIDIDPSWLGGFDDF